jgi:Ca-activated chloride channel family protein
MKVKLITYLLGSFALLSYSQEEKQFIHKGNKSFDKGDYTEAELNYRKALEKNNSSVKGSFNLGDALFKQGKYAEAAGQFEAITNHSKNSDTLSKAFHNLGNSLLRQKKYEESINAYKKALKNNPDDEETRYNLSYAMRMLKQQQQKQQQNKDDKNKDKKDQKQDKKEDQKKENKKDDQKKEQQQQQISQEDAKRLLESLNNDEKKLQEKLKKQKGKGTKSEIEKDW